MIAVLVDIRSRENVGSIFRTSDAVGIEKLYLVGITPAPVDRFGRKDQKLGKAALGAEESVGWEHVATIEELYHRLRGSRWIAVEQDKKSTPYFKFNPTKKDREHSALVMGNEVEGLPLSVLKRMDQILEIPMRGKKESLNVAVAFGIVAFHLQHTT